MGVKLITATHKKTGNIYHVLDVAVTDCTNSREGTQVILYYRNGKFFVREKEEFNEKFLIKN